MADNFRVAVFTAFTRGYDQLRPNQRESNVDFIAFTDTSDVLLSDPWIGRPLPSMSSNSKRNCVYVKTHPFALLPGYDFYLWMDARLSLSVTVAELIEIYSRESTDWDLVTFKHPRNVRVRDEVAEVEQEGLIDPSEVAEFEEFVGAAGLELSPMWETNLMLFRPTEASNLFFQNWWEVFERTPPRDQLSVLQAASLAPVKGRFFERGLTDASNSAYVTKGKHLRRRDTKLRKHRAAGTAPEQARGVPTYSAGQSHIRKLQQPLEVVVPFHNNAAALGRLFDSLNWVEGELALIVVDNGSSAWESLKCTELVQKSRHEVRHIRVPSGLGFGGASNVGISEAFGEFVLLLNSDTRMPAFEAEEVVALARESNLLGLGFVGNRAGDQSVARQIAEQLIDDNPAAWPYVLNSLHAFCRAWSTSLPVTEVRTIHGSAVLVNRQKFLDLDGFDDVAFPIGYGEEVDLWLRGARKGYRVGFTTSLYYWHDGQGTFGEGLRRRLNLQGRSVLRSRYPWVPWDSISGDIQSLPILRALDHDMNLIFQPRCNLPVVDG